MKNNTITELDGILSNIIIPKQSVVVFGTEKFIKQLQMKFALAGLQ